VSIHITLGHAHEREMLADFGRISAQCDRFGMPLLAMVYLDKSAAKAREGVVSELHAVRVAQELGADIIKLADPGDDGLLAEIVTSLQVPVVVGGGARQESAIFLQRIHAMMASGVDGIAVGRNIFQSADIESDFSRLYAAVHKVPAISVLGREPARGR